MRKKTTIDYYDYDSLFIVSLINLFKKDIIPTHILMLVLMLLLYLTILETWSRNGLQSPSQLS